jgi:hypothetical protein
VAGIVFPMKFASVMLAFLVKLWWSTIERARFCQKVTNEMPIVASSVKYKPAPYPASLDPEHDVKFTNRMTFDPYVLRQRQPPPDAAPICESHFSHSRNVQASVVVRRPSVSDSAYRNWPAPYE